MHYFTDYVFTVHAVKIDRKWIRECKFCMRQWLMNRLDLNRSLTRWKYQNEKIPKSVCSEPCPAGHVKKVKGVHCCWVCIQCREYEIITDDERCLMCPNGTFPTLSPARNVCEPLPVDYLSLDSRWAVVPVVFSLIGIVAVTRAIKPTSILP